MIHRYHVILNIKKGIWLIGYDGNIKAHSEDNSILLNLYNIIDSMPIRKSEIEASSINC